MKTKQLSPMEMNIASVRRWAKHDKKPLPMTMRMGNRIVLQMSYVQGSHDQMSVYQTTIEQGNVTPVVLFCGNYSSGARTAAETALKTLSAIK